MNSAGISKRAVVLICALIFFSGSVNLKAGTIVLPLWCKGNLNYCLDNGWVPPGGTPHGKYDPPGPGTEPDGVTPHVPVPIPPAPPDRPIDPAPEGAPLCFGVLCGAGANSEVSGLINSLLDGKTPAQRAAAAAALGQLSKEALPALPALLFTAAASPNGEVREAADRAVERIGLAQGSKYAALSVRPLEKLVLYGGAGPERCRAAVALESLGCAAAPAVPALREAVEFYSTSSGEADRMRLAELRICRKECGCAPTSIGDGAALERALAPDERERAEGGKGLRCPE